MTGQEETPRDARLIEELVMEARSGSRDALEKVVGLIQGQVFSLSLRMLFHPADAEDATQEILIKVVTNLRGFRFEGPFRAWVMRIAANHLKGVRKRRGEEQGRDVDWAVDRLDRAQSRGWFSNPLPAPEPMVEAEMRAICAQALLMCLDRDHRLAFILGAVMGVGGREGGYILDISAGAFRKRLSRARQRMAGFLEGNCALFNPDNRCTCQALAAGYVESGWLAPRKRLFMRDEQGATSGKTLGHYLKELDELGRLSAFFQASPPEGDNPDFAEWFKSLLGAGKYAVLDLGTPGDGEGETRH